jgi:uncharacterized membrane protein
MSKTRLSSFSDGVLSIIITIMALELKVPNGVALSDLIGLYPIFLSYILSFIYIGIYWSNHHHLFHLVEQVNGKVLWANIHLLFWLSLIPFVTAWSGERHFASLPVALYGVVLFFSAFAYYLLVKVLITSHEKNSELARAIGNDFKGKVSPALYAIGIPLAFYYPYLSLVCYVLVAALWFIPDRRVEDAVVEAESINQDSKKK